MTFANVPPEDVRLYWDDRPCNLRHSPEPVGTRRYFDEVERRKYFVEPHIPGFAQFDQWKDKRVLEVGCGIGTDTINFARAGALVTAVDISPRSLGFARWRAHRFGLQDRIEFIEADVEHLTATLDAPLFDLVYSFGAVHHTPHPRQALRQMRQYMGLLSDMKLMLYHRRSTKVAGIVARDWRPGRTVDEVVARHSEAATGCPVTYTYTRRSAEALLRSAGLEAVYTEVNHIFPYRVEDYREYRYVKRLGWRLTPPTVFTALERKVGWHLCITARMTL